MKDTIIERAGKIAYMYTGEDYQRMRGFKTLSTSKNAAEYSRQYVDERTERTDVTGYSESVSFEMDRFKGDAVHDKIETIFERELTGIPATVSIGVVDFSKDPVSIGACVLYPAHTNSYSVVPSSEGDTTDALTFSGDFRSNGSKTKAAACCDDGLWQNCYFIPGEICGIKAEAGTSSDGMEYTINDEDFVIFRFDLSGFNNKTSDVKHAELAFSAAPREYVEERERYEGGIIRIYRFKKESLIEPPKKGWDGKQDITVSDFDDYDLGSVAETESKHYIPDDAYLAPYQMLAADVTEALRGRITELSQITFVIRAKTARAQGIPCGGAALIVHV